MLSSHNSQPNQKNNTALADTQTLAFILRTPGPKGITPNLNRAYDVPRRPGRRAQISTIRLHIYLPKLRLALRSIRKSRNNQIRLRPPCRQKP